MFIMMKLAVVQKPRLHHSHIMHIVFEVYMHIHITHQFNMQTLELTRWSQISLSPCGSWWWWEFSITTICESGI